MKINDITLYNFGSYEGETKFETLSTANKNIVLIGGKNGAGKTTLFTAMRLCLYGYMSMGYKSSNSFYIKAITKLINNSAKISRPANAHISMNLEMNNMHGVDTYTLCRKWVLSESLTESFAVSKNGVELTADEIADFEKYILSLLPPELFNLYFFDGEKIADFFLNEGSGTRIKEAFLTLCGYDTFDIMRKNFKRISANSSSSTPELDEYLSAKESLNAAQEENIDISTRLRACIDEINDCEAAIISLEKEYHQSGGITEEEWNKKLSILKEEEKKRESYNTLLRKWANEIVPFLMIRNKIVALKEQIEKENDSLKYKHFCEVLEETKIQNLIKSKLDELKYCAFELFGDDEMAVLNLSLEQNALLLNQINQIISFDETKIEKCKRAIKRSLNLTAKIRKELETSSVTSVQEYMQKRAALFEEKSALLVQRVELEKALTEQKEKVSFAEQQLSKIQSKLEEDLKNASIKDISLRAIIMLDKLQESLYKKQIKKVESFFRKEIKALMRKTNFIDDIYIDDNFNTHIYRTESFTAERIIESLSTNSEEQVIAILGEKAVTRLKKLAKSDSKDDIIEIFMSNEIKEYDLPVEIDKTSLSNGEKQIFIMALYHALVNLCSHEIPFIIDTPFARIDTEHRKNISKYFFSKLNGQVFILSTNEEINSSHVKILSDKISATYMLENTDNKRTVVVKNSYFEV